MELNYLNFTCWGVLGQIYTSNISTSITTYASAVGTSRLTNFFDVNVVAW